MTVYQESESNPFIIFEIVRANMSESAQCMQERLHRQVARALEVIYPNNLDQISDQLVIHYEQARFA